MLGIFDIVGRLKRRAEAIRAERREAEEEARALLAAGSRGEALRILREAAQGADPKLRRRIDRVRAAVSRLAAGPPKADLATRMHYRDL